MKEKKIIKKLEQSLDEKRYVRFKMRHPDKDAYSGVVIHIGDNYFAMRTFNDFAFDSVDIFPFSSIKGYDDTKFQWVAQEVIAANGDLEDLKMPDWLTDCPAIRDVIAKMHELDIWPAVEDVITHGTGYFYVGPITKVKKNTFLIYAYGGDGEWEGEYRLRYESIFRVVAEDDYINKFNAYMRAKDAAAESQL